MRGDGCELVLQADRKSRRRRKNAGCLSAAVGYCGPTARSPLAFLFFPLSLVVVVLRIVHLPSQRVGIRGDVAEAVAGLDYRQLPQRAWRVPALPDGTWVIGSEWWRGGGSDCATRALNRGLSLHMARNFCWWEGPNLSPGSAGGHRGATPDCAANPPPGLALWYCSMLARFPHILRRRIPMTFSSNQTLPMT